MHDHDLADLALAYAAAGWPVHPVEPGGKRPATAHGCHDATTDPDQVAAWWRRRPTCNIGLATGHAFDVLDLDGDRGIESWSTFTDANGLPFDLTSQYVVATPSGGYHLYWQPTGHGNRGKMLPDVDWRGLGGLVVAAGSRRPDGVYEVWHDGPIPPAPPALVELVARLDAPASDARTRPEPVPADLGNVRNRYALGVLENSCDTIANARRPAPGQPGNRHETLIRMAMRVMAYVNGGDIVDSYAVQWLTNAALGVGIDEPEIATAIASARIKATPRTAPPLTARSS